MRFTLSWLKKFLDTEATLDQITNKLTMIGLEVEEVTDRIADLGDFEIAEIASAKQHPDADKLQVCDVLTSSGNAQIVCGAPNARAGIKVVLAKEGVVIPSGGFKIKKAKIRGVESNGMLCSADELGIGGDSEGIIELDLDAKVGDSFAEYMGFDDPVIHINITPNRADALGVYGVARDLAAAGIGTLKHPIIPVIDSKFTAKRNVDILNKEASKFFAFREIRGIDNSKSPKWLVDLLDNAGIGSISPVVDVTNYISYSFGQPMHAYDADKFDGDIQVKLVDKEIPFAALNGKEYKLAEGDLVVADKNQPHCVAGIIGGTDSAASADTKAIILEAASFDADYIARTGRRMQVDTDSRYRFERYVDSEFTTRALDIATSMILEICGGEASDLATDGNEKLPVRNVEFSPEFLASRTGIQMTSAEIAEHLGKLGFTCESEGSNMNITIPSWRYDVALKEDIVEEVTRIYGYDNIPLEPLPGAKIERIIPKLDRRISEFKRVLATRGLDEVLTWSFTDSKKAKHFTKLEDSLYIANPISSEMDYMRPSILPNLLQVAVNNLNRSIDDISLFEVGPVYDDPAKVDVVYHAAAVRIGSNEDRSYYGSAREFDVFDAKSDFAALLSAAGLDIKKCRIDSGKAPSYYHPSRSAALYLGKNLLGYVGQMHPMILKLYGIEQRAVAFEQVVTNLPFAKSKFGMKPGLEISNFQPVSRDFAFLVDIKLPVGEMLSTIENLDKKLITDVSLFDIYTGKGIDEGQKSVAISVGLQSQDKTLTDDEIGALSKRIVDTCKDRYSAILRDN